MDIKVLYDKLAIKVEDNLAGTGPMQDDVYRGTVVAAGPGFLQLDGTYVPLRVKVGDQVYFRAECAVTIFEPQDKTAYRVIKEEDVDAVIPA